MAGEVDQLIIAIATQASDATLLAVTSDVYYGKVPKGKTMPWVRYQVISEVPTRTFNASGDWQEAIVQFSIFDKDSPNGTSVVNQIFSDLNVVYDRQTLSYDSLTHMSCNFEGSIGPTWLDEDDVWMLTADYRVRWQ